MSVYLLQNVSAVCASPVDVPARETRNQCLPITFISKLASEAFFTRHF